MKFGFLELNVEFLEVNDLMLSTVDYEIFEMSFLKQIILFNFVMDFKSLFLVQHGF